MKKRAMPAVLTAMAAMGAVAQQKQLDEAIVDGSASVRTEITISPVLHIELGSGPEARDVVKMEARSVLDYKEGKTARVDRQLKLLAIGTGYAVDAKIGFPHSEEEFADIAEVFSLWLLPPGEEMDHNNFHKIKLSPYIKGLYKGGPDGERELDAAYRIKWLQEYNLQAYNRLASKNRSSSTYTIDVCYVIVPN